MADPLNPAAILQAMAEALPTHPQGDTTSDISSSYEALALFAHACMVNLGFRLLGFNEDQKTESDCASLAPRLPPAWNASFNSHSFVYAHSQSSMTFVLKIDRMGGQAAIRGLAVGAERVHSLDITARDYISSAALPLRIPAGPDGGAEPPDRSAALTPLLQNVFISRERMADLAALLKVDIIQKLAPALQKDGYQDSNPDDRAARADADDAGRRGGAPARQPPPPAGLPDPARPYPFDDPLAAPPAAPRRPFPAGDFPPPGFEDEHEILAPPRGGGALPGGGLPFGGLGHDDLHPPGLGPHDPLRASFVPRPGGFSGGGMHPAGLDDPVFGGRGGGGGGFDPQAPPGARYDDPTGGLGGLPRFGGGRPGGGRGGNNPFGGGGFGGDII